MTWGCKQDRAISFALPKVDRWRLPPLPATPEGDDSVREAAKVCPQQPLAGRPDPRQTFTAHQITHRGRLERLLLRKLGSTRSDSCGSAARLGLAKPNDRSRCPAAVHGAEPGGGCGSSIDRPLRGFIAGKRSVNLRCLEAADRHLLLRPVAVCHALAKRTVATMVARSHPRFAELTKKSGRTRNARARPVEESIRDAGPWRSRLPAGVSGANFLNASLRRCSLSSSQRPNTQRTDCR